ncbi:BTB and MATH domain-containing protein 36-like [Porites lutea]|uniref:BTB and MATH domain-containing protein 36-like n=1 Tax=Porites lutea TaxID=51062 RepID=UPI003CC65D4B
MAQADAPPYPTDFLEPWMFSDVVLVVEDQKFHVHRSILAVWSPVFEKMFTSEFKEKNKDEIPLPGKKASEIKQLLYMLYPSLEEKQVTKTNCYFLLELAHEYRIQSIVEKCQSFMVVMVKEKMEDDVLAMLIYGQKYQLKTLISACIDGARRLSLKELKRHKGKIEPDNYLSIAEGIIQRLETQCDEVREGSLKCLARVCQNLYWHDREKNNSRAPSTDVVLNHLLKDVDKSSGDVVCNSLKCVAEELTAQKKILETLPSFQRKNTLNLTGLRRLRR